jgi:NADPH:quinone reductase-like Zn-dependent oxidoreductase
MRAFELLPRPGFDSLNPTERPDPAPRQGEVLVRIRAASLNWRDLLVARSAEAAGVGGLIPLSDGAGEVVALGEGVSTVAVGDRVAGAFFQSWVDGAVRMQDHGSALGGAIDGVAAEIVRLRADAVVHIPSHLSFEQAATLPCAAVTAWHALFVAASVKPGDLVLIQGTGGVSLFGLQLARAAGAEVVVTSSDDAKLERARALGAAHVINYRKVPAWGEAAARLGGGRGVDLVLDVGGPGTLDGSIDAVRTGGTVCVIGILTGVAGSIHVQKLLPKLATLRGIYVGSVAMFEAMNRAIERLHLTPVVDRVFELADLREAYAHVAGGTHFGKVVVRFPS